MRPSAAFADALAPNDPDPGRRRRRPNAVCNARANLDPVDDGLDDLAPLVRRRLRLLEEVAETAHGRRQVLDLLFDAVELALEAPGASTEDGIRQVRIAESFHIRLDPVAFREERSGGVGYPFSLWPHSLGRATGDGFLDRLRHDTEMQLPCR